MKVPAEGGRPFRLAEARGAGGATWLRDDTLIFAPMYSEGLFRVAAAETDETGKIVTDVTGFEMLAIRNSESGWTGSFFFTSA